MFYGFDDIFDQRSEVGLVGLHHQTFFNNSKINNAIALILCNKYLRGRNFREKGFRGRNFRELRPQNLSASRKKFELTMEVSRKKFSPIESKEDEKLVARRPFYKFTKQYNGRFQLEFSGFFSRQSNYLR